MAEIEHERARKEEERLQAIEARRGKNGKEEGNDEVKDLMGFGDAEMTDELSGQEDIDERDIDQMEEDELPAVSALNLGDW